MHRALSWLSAIIAAISIPLLGISGVSAETRFAVPGALGLGVWALLSVGQNCLEGWRHRASNWALATVVLAAGYIAWRTGFSGQTQGAARDLTLLLLALAGWIGAICFSWRDIGSRGAALGFGLLILLHAVAAISQAAGIGTSLLQLFGFGPVSANALRIRGFYSHYIFFGNWAAILGTSCLAWWLWSSNKQGRAWVALGLAILGHLLALVTLSRGTILTLALTDLILLLHWVFLRRRLQRRLRISLAAAVIVLFAVCSTLLLTSQGFAERMRQWTGRDLEQAVAGSDVRVQVWNGSAELWRMNPWFGWGSQATDWAFVMAWPDDLEAWLGKTQFAHNEYLQILDDYGMIGLVLLVGLLALHLGNGLRNLTRPAGLFQRANSESLTAAGLACAIATILHCLTDFAAHMPANCALMGFGFGLLARAPSTPRPARLPAFQSAFMLASSAAAVLLFSVSLPGVLGWMKVSRAAVIAGNGNPTERQSSAGELVASGFSELSREERVSRNEVDWMRLSYQAWQAGEKDGTNLQSWNLRALLAAREGRAMNSDSSALLSWHVRTALALNQLDEAEEAARLGWELYRARHYLFLWNLDLAHVEVLRADLAKNRGDWRGAEQHSRFALGWLGLGWDKFHYSQESARRFDSLSQYALAVLASSPSGATAVSAPQ